MRQGVHYIKIVPAERKIQRKDSVQISPFLFNCSSYEIFILSTVFF